MSTNKTLTLSYGAEEPGAEKPGAEGPGAEGPGAEEPGSEEPWTEETRDEEPWAEELRSKDPWEPSSYNNGMSSSTSDFRKMLLLCCKRPYNSLEYGVGYHTLTANKLG